MQKEYGRSRWKRRNWPKRLINSWPPCFRANKRRRLAILLCVPVLTLFTVFYFHWNGQPAAWVAAIGLCGLWIGKVSGWLWTIYLHNQVSSLLQKLPEVHYTPITASFGEQMKIGDLSLAAADLQTVVPLKHTLLFFHHQDQMFIVAHPRDRQ